MAVGIKGLWSIWKRLLLRLAKELRAVETAKASENMRRGV